jgi:molybdopterin molybdotransferase
MSGDDLLSVAQARARILADAAKVRPVEAVALERATGRTLAVDLAAKRTQPPQAVSAMDGYAVRARDLAELPVKLKQIGESTAGHGFPGSLGLKETVRIFTGAPVPEGCDTILIQENARVEAGFVEPLETLASGRHIRAKGIDFAEGEVLLAAGTRLRASNIALAAAMNFAEVSVNRKPRVGILATGNELVQPGETVGADQIVASNSFAIAALVEAAGGEPLDLGIARDELGALAEGIRAARAATDVLVTLGGASVGDYDLVKPALAGQGMELSFWRIAMRPGKPVIHGRLGPMIILGLPGNPVAAFVAGIVFLVPLVRALCGDPDAGRDQSEPAILGKALPANDSRQDFLRAALRPAETGLPVATPFEIQDSSLLRILAQAQCLVVREPHAEPAAAGDLCRIIRLGS